MLCCEEDSAEIPCGCCLELDDDERAAPIVVNEVFEDVVVDDKELSGIGRERSINLSRRVER